MSSSEQLVVDSFRLLGAINITEASCSPAEMTLGLRLLSQMVDGWAASGMNVTDLSMTGDFTSGDDEVEVEDTSRLAPGMILTATGVTSRRILKIDSDTQFTMDGNASANGAAVSIGFALLPLQARFEEPVTALLAKRLSPRIGLPLTAEVLSMANEGEGMIRANFMPAPRLVVDAAIILTTLRG